MSCNCGSPRPMNLSDLQNLSDPKTMLAIGIALTPVLALMFLNSWIERRS